MSITSIGFIGGSGCRTVNYRESFRSDHHESINRVELAGLLSGLDRHETNFVLAKYRCDESAQVALMAHVRVYAAGLAVRGKWKIVRGKPIVYNMGGLAVIEAISPGRCGRCNGTGLLSGRACATCSGTGHKTISGRARAQYVGVDEKQWRQVWKSRYEDIHSYVLQIESSAEIKLEQVARQDPGTLA